MRRRTPVQPRSTYLGFRTPISQLKDNLHNSLLTYYRPVVSVKGNAELTNELIAQPKAVYPLMDGRAFFAI